MCERTTSNAQNPKHSARGCCPAGAPPATMPRIRKVSTIVQVETLEIRAEAVSVMRTCLTTHDFLKRRWYIKTSQWLEAPRNHSFSKKVRQSAYNTSWGNPQTATPVSRRPHSPTQRDQANPLTTIQHQMPGKSDQAATRSQQLEVTGTSSAMWQPG